MERLTLKAKLYKPKACIDRMECLLSDEHQFENYWTRPTRKPRWQWKCGADKLFGQPTSTADFVRWVNVWS